MTTKAGKTKEPLDSRGFAKIRITGLPGDINAVIRAIDHAPGVYVVGVSKKYPNRQSDEYRVYIEVNII